MAESLGPIHYMMYEKIKYQDRLTRKLLADQAEVLQDLDQRQPPVSTEALETLIDQANIHGWLASKVDIVENRLAFAQAHATDALGTMREAGREAAAGKQFADGEALFGELNLYLLDGMPCDRALGAAALAQGEGLQLTQQVEVHERYAEDLLAVDPASSLQKGCAGDDDHEDHDAFHVKEAAADEATKENKVSSERSLFYRCREAFLEGFLAESAYRVEATGDYDFRLTAS